MNMKKFNIALFSIAFILILGACGSSNNNADSTDNQPVSEGLENNNNVDNEEENASSRESNNGEDDTDNNDEKNDKMNDIGMTEFELEGDQAEGEFEDKIDQSSSGRYEAE